MSAIQLISLLPSGTEIVHALGLGSMQVGRSHECDHPAEVVRLPVCSRPNISVSGSSREIDDAVKTRLRQAVSIYDLDWETIGKLKPTHILTQSQCEVCAVSLGDVERAVQRETASDVRLISLQPDTLASVWQDIRKVASALEQDAAADLLVKSLEAKISAIKKRASASIVRPRVAAIEWLEPLMAAGNWIPELIENAAGQSIFGAAGQHSDWMQWDEIVAADPDVIIALPCGFDLPRTRSEMHWLTERDDWRSQRAVRNGQVYICDGNQFMNRPGPRITESQRIFAEILHPGLFEPTLENVGWERF